MSHVVSYFKDSLSVMSKSSRINVQQYISVLTGNYSNLKYLSIGNVLLWQGMLLCFDKSMVNKEALPVFVFLFCKINVYK